MTGHVEVTAVRGGVSVGVWKHPAPSRTDPVRMRAEEVVAHVGALEEALALFYAQQPGSAGSEFADGAKASQWRGAWLPVVEHDGDDVLVRVWDWSWQGKRTVLLRPEHVRAYVDRLMEVPV